MWSLSDESLLEGLASGDPEATKAFVGRFQARVFGLALTMLGDHESAKEVAQETFIRAWRHAGGYDPTRGRVASWLLTITRNLARDAQGGRRDEPMDPEAIAALPLCAPDDPQDRVSAREEHARLREAIAALPEEQRRALLLAAFGGRSAREISGLEGIPLGTAKSRIRSAVRRLRSAMEVGNGR